MRGEGGKEGLARRRLDGYDENAMVRKEKTAICIDFWESV